jgi:RNA polymerase sigma-70 factor (ECF subfamily)
LDQRIASEGRNLAELLRAASLGDRGAFRALYEATSPKLFGVILRITRNRMVAEEILQETYVKVWQNAARFTPEAGHPLAWLATIARNRAIDRLRAEKFERNRAGDDDALDRLAAPGGADPAEREALRACLQGLDEEARSCVVLAYCSGFSREELAERFNRPVGTIKTILHRSIGLLRQCLER